MSEIRENRLTGEWVIVAPERAKRGGMISPANAFADLPPHAANCPFCTGNEQASEECFRIEDADGHWLIRSVVNKFSVLSPTGEVEHTKSAPPGEEASVNGVGPHEVVVESPLHNASIASSSVAHVTRILEVWRLRFLALYTDPRVRHVILFKNHGAQAGASQLHPHSQIVGLPIVPGQVAERIERGRAYFQKNGRCLACGLIAQERAHGCRIVAETTDFVAFIPYGALSPYHLWIFPKVHTACYSDHSALPALAEVLQGILARIHGLLGNPAFNLVIRSLGPHEADASHFHWYVSIVARVNTVAGFELGTGMYINPSSPEDCAQALREFSPA